MANKILRVLWSYHTTPQSTTRETPFSLVYRTDAITLVEILESSLRVRKFNEQALNEGCRDDLAKEEVRENSRIHFKALKRRIERKQKTKVIPR